LIVDRFGWQVFRLERQVFWDDVVLDDGVKP
jgi:hypothetical protein